MLFCVTTTDEGTKTITLPVSIWTKGLCRHYRHHCKHSHRLMIHVMNKCLAGMIAQSAPRRLTSLASVLQAQARSDIYQNMCSTKLQLKRSLEWCRAHGDTIIANNIANSIKNYSKNSGKKWINIEGIMTHYNALFNDPTHRNGSTGV